MRAEPYRESNMKKKKKKKTKKKKKKKQIRKTMEMKDVTAHKATNKCVNLMSEFVRSRKKYFGNVKRTIIIRRSEKK